MWTNMWTKQKGTEVPGSSPAHAPGSPTGAFNPTPIIRPNSTTARNPTCLGTTLEIEGKITSKEDLYIEGKVEGPISVQGQRLNVGRTGQLHCEVTAREVVVHGQVTGNLHARERVEIKKGGSVIGDITTARISIEEGARFKGHIEIDGPKRQAVRDSESVGVPVAAAVHASTP